MKAPNEGPRVALATQVLIALALGVATGLFFGEIVAPLQLLGDAFIRLLQITVIPYISVSLITGLGRLELSEVKRLAARGGGVLLLLWSAAIGVVLLLPLSYPNWPTRSLFQREATDAVATPDFLELYIPSNPFSSFANATVPAVVVFSIMLGVALTGLKNKQVLIEPLSILAELLAKITSFVSKLAPIGVFALIANTTGTMSFDDLARLQVYVVVAVSMLAIFGIWLLPGLVSSLTPLKHVELLRRLRTPLITGFATGSSLVVLPMLTQVCKELVAEADPRWRPPEEEEERASPVGVLVPTFYSFPTAGAVLSLGFVLFAGWYIGSGVSTGVYPRFLSAGLASLFGGTALAIPFSLGLAELPRDLFRLFLSADVIVSRFTTFVSVMHYATIALIGTFALQRRVRVRRKEILRVGLVGALAVFAVLGGVRAFYTHVVVVPYTKDELLKGLHNLREPQPSLVHREAPEHRPEVSPSRVRSLEEIRRSGVLRVCYADGNYPLSFFNSAGKLVGFDIEMAHRFAERMRAPDVPSAKRKDLPGEMSLEFLPVRGADDLTTGYCDVFFNSTALALGREEHVARTAPFETITLAFIVADHRRDEFASWNDLGKKSGFKVALSAFQGLETEIKRLLPGVETVRLSSYEDQAQYFEGGSEQVFAFLDSAEEGAAWTVLYPRYSVVVPRPVVRLPVAYAVAPGNPSLLVAMNEWLTIERESGGIDELYDYWIHGKTDAVKSPRWSVIRDLLHWVE